MARLNKTKNTIEGTLWGIASKLIAIIFPFIIRTIIIKRMGSEYAGLTSLFTSVLQVLSLAELGFGSAMVYSMYKPIAEDDQETISALLNYYRKIYFAIGIVVLILGAVTTPFIPLLIKGSVPSDINIYVLFSIFLLNTVSSYLFLAYRASLLSAYQREADNYRIQVVNNLVLYLLQIILLIKFQNYYIYIITLPVFTIILNFEKYLFTKKKYPEIKCYGDISKEQKDELKQKVEALLLHKVGSVTVNTVDNLVISAFLGIVALSNYNNYYYLISAVTALVMICFSSITAGIGNSIILDSVEKNKKLFYSIFCANGAIVVVCTTCLFALYQDFIELWLGQEFLYEELTMVFLCIYFFVHTIRRTIIMFRDGAGLWEDNKFQPIVSAAFNLSLNIFLVKRIGINGIVISTIVSMLLIDIPWESIAFFKKVFNDTIKQYLVKTIYYFMLAIISCAILHFVKSTLHFSDLKIKLVVDLIFSIVVSSSIFIIGNNRSEDFIFIKEKVKMLKKKAQL